MYGWRAIIGFMVPSSCTVYEPEFHKMTRDLDGVLGCASRLLIEGTDAEGLTVMNQQIEKAAQELATINPDIVAYACTSGSFVEGKQGDQRIRHQIQAITGTPVVSTSQAVVAALRQLDTKQIAMLTPYNRDVTLQEMDYLETTGIKVVDYHFLDIEDNLDRGAQVPEVTFYHARKLDIESADAIFTSCTNIRTLDIIPLLEQHTGKPVVSSNQATTWLALRKAGVHEAIADLGHLFTLPYHETTG
jgi:maleate isomerase